MKAFLVILFGIVVLVCFILAFYIILSEKKETKKAKQKLEDIKETTRRNSVAKQKLNTGNSLTDFNNSLNILQNLNK